MPKKMSAKQIQEALLKAENDIVRAATLYCAEHNMEFSGKHRILTKVMLRKFFCDGVYPLMRDLFDTNVKRYHD